MANKERDYYNFTNLLYNNMKISNTKSVVLVRAVFVNSYCQAEAWLHPGIVVTQSLSVSVAFGIIISGMPPTNW